jgi:peptide chain release factor subunit 1
VYIPPKRIISDITNRLNVQFAEAASIKDKGNRNSVQEALSAAVLSILLCYF